MKYLLWVICIFSFAAEVMPLVCESYDHKCQKSDSTAAKNSTCSSSQQCDHMAGMTPACYTLLSQNKEGGLEVTMKGCIATNGQECAPTVCSGQGKKLGKLRPLYYCCCTQDRCNRDVVMLISDETGKSTIDDVKESIRSLTLLIWAHLMTLTIILGIIAIGFMVWKLVSWKRRRKTSRKEKRLTQVVCDRGFQQHHNTSRWKKHDFQLITCLVRSTFGEIWQARLHGSNRVVRIRVTAGSDDVYVYDKHVTVKNTNVNAARVV